MLLFIVLMGEYSFQTLNCLSLSTFLSKEPRERQGGNSKFLEIWHNFLSYLFSIGYIRYA